MLEPSSMFKGFSSIFLIIIAAAIALGGGTYLAVRNSGAPKEEIVPLVQPPPPQTGEPVVIPGWKTYVNDEFGFSFQYPPTIKDIQIEIIGKSEVIYGPHGDPSPPNAPSQIKVLSGNIISIVLPEKISPDLSKLNTYSGIWISSRFSAEKIENYFPFGGGSDGGPEYQYDSINKIWRRNLSGGPLTLSWNDFFVSYNGEKTNAGDDIIKNKVFPQTFYPLGDLAGCPSCGYHVFSANRGKYIHFRYGGSLLKPYGNYSESTMQENLKYQEALESALEKMAESVVFF